MPLLFFKLSEKFKNIISKLHFAQNPTFIPITSALGHDLPSRDGGQIPPLSAIIMQFNLCLPLSTFVYLCLLLLCNSCDCALKQIIHILMSEILS